MAKPKQNQGNTGNENNNSQNRTQIIVAIIGAIAAIIAALIAIMPLLKPDSGPLTQDGNFEYQVSVQVKGSGSSLSGAQVRIEVGSQAPLIEITDTNGIARIFIDATREGQPARLIVEAQGYRKFVQNIDLRKEVLPATIQLDRNP